MSDPNVRKAVDAANAAFAAAMNKGDIAGACSVYTEDARVLPPDGPMVLGRKAIEGFWRAAVPALGVKSVALRTIELAVTGSAAHEIGEATLQLESGPAVIKYVVVWRQEASGQWRWAVDIWNNGGVV